MGVSRDSGMTGIAERLFYLLERRFAMFFNMLSLSCSERAAKLA
jgi:hypothetical protein